jgi:hypothetical protein
MKMDEHNHIEKHFIENISSGLLYNGFVDSIVKKYYKENMFLHFLWHLLHSFSYSYSINCFDICGNCIIDENQLQELCLFIQNIYTFITGCNNKCNNHYTLYIQNNNIIIEHLLKQKYGLFHFFIDIHNDITSNFNKYTQRKKKIFTYIEVENIYNKYDYISFLRNKYNIDIIQDILSNTFSFEKVKISIDVIKKQIYNSNIEYSIKIL